MNFEVNFPKNKNKIEQTVTFIDNEPFIENNDISRNLSFERSTGFIITPTLLAYKKSLMIKLIFGFILFLCFIFERIFYSIFQLQETYLILKLQDAWFGSKTPDDVSPFYYYIGKLGEFHVLFLLMTHYLVTLYVAIDAIIALKIIYISIISIFILSVFSFINTEARPYWIDLNVKAFFCDRTYSDPGIFTFLILFLIIYSYRCFSQKEEELLATTPFGFENSFSDFGGMEDFFEKQKKWINRFFLVVSLMIFLFILFMRFLIGLEFLINYFLSFLLFSLIYAFVLSADSFIEDLIKQSTILKLYAKRMVFLWLIYLLLIEGLAWVLYSQSNQTYDIYYIQNYYRCKNRNQPHSQHDVLYDEVIGKKETFQVTAIVFALIGLAFGASQTFRTISSMNWYKGSFKIRLIRAIIANLAVIPSWVFITYQDYLINLNSTYILGISNLMMDCLHYFLLYYGLFGVIPVYIYLYFDLAFMDLKFSMVLH